MGKDRALVERVVAGTATQTDRDALWASDPRRYVEAVGQYASAQAARARLTLLKLIATLAFVVIALLGYTIFQSYEGRVDLVKVVRAGCARGILDRTDLANVSSATLLGFQQTDKRLNKPLTAERKQAEGDLATAHSGASSRAQINCHEAYPDASLWP